MGWQPRPLEGSPGKGEASWGAGGRKTAQCCGSQLGGGVYQGGGRGVGQTWRGPVLAGRRAERLEPFSRVLRRAGRGRKNKPRHTLGGCRLARDLGTTSQVPGSAAKAAFPREPTPDWAGLGQFHNCFLGLLGMGFYRVWDNSVLFQTDGLPGPERWFSSHVVYVIPVC